MLLVLLVKSQLLHFKVLPPNILVHHGGVEPLLLSVKETCPNRQTNGALPNKNILGYQSTTITRWLTTLSSSDWSTSTLRSNIIQRDHRIRLCDFVSIFHDTLLTPHPSMQPSEKHPTGIGNPICFCLAPRTGFEPMIAESKSAVLPLHYQGTETT